MTTPTANKWSHFKPSRWARVRLTNSADQEAHPDWRHRKYATRIGRVPGRCKWLRTGFLVLTNKAIGGDATVASMAGLGAAIGQVAMYLSLVLVVFVAFRYNLDGIKKSKRAKSDSAA